MLFDDIPNDDLIDVTELHEKIMKSNIEILGDHEISIALSALVCATVNTIASQASDIREVLTYRDVTNRVFNMLIQNIKLNPE